MCFSVEIDVNLKKLSRQFNAEIKGIENEHIKITALGPSKKDHIPVIAHIDGALVIKSMVWSLTPSWAKEPIKWNTYNARMTRQQKGTTQKIYDVPTFKGAFRKNQFCLIPVSTVIESCYWGETKGNIVGFNRADNEPFYVLGLWDTESCTMLTDAPYNYLYEKGHDRSVVLVEAQNGLDLMQNTALGHVDSFNKIMDIRTDQDWSHRLIRPLKDGWQKRAPSESKVLELGESVYSKFGLTRRKLYS